MADLHLHWIFLATEEGRANPVKMNVMAISETEALMRVEELVVRPQYHLVEMYECSSCAANAAIRTTQKELLNFIKSQRD
jgi:hypothetical protein